MNLANIAYSNFGGDGPNFGAPEGDTSEGGLRLRERDDG